MWDEEEPWREPDTVPSDFRFDREEVTTKKKKSKKKSHVPTTNQVPNMSLAEFARHKVLDGLLWTQRSGFRPPRIVFPMSLTDHALMQERVTTVGRGAVVNAPQPAGEETDGITDHSFFPETTAFFTLLRKQQGGRETMYELCPEEETERNTVEDDLEHTLSIMSAFPRHLPVRNRHVLPAGSPNRMSFIFSTTDEMRPGTGLGNAGRGKLIRLFLMEEADDLDTKSEAVSIHNFIRQDMFLPDYIGMTCRIMQDTGSRAIVRIFFVDPEDEKEDAEVLTGALATLIAGANGGRYVSVRVEGAVAVTEVEANDEVRAEALAMEVEAIIMPSPTDGMLKSPKGRNRRKLTNLGTTDTASLFGATDGRPLTPAVDVHSITEEAPPVVLINDELLPTEVVESRPPSPAAPFSPLKAKALADMMEALLGPDDMEEDEKDHLILEEDERGRKTMKQIQAAFDAGEPIYPQCDRCEEEESWWWCNECNLYVCLLCDAALHIGRMMSAHGKALLPGRRLVKAAATVDVGSSVKGKLNLAAAKAKTTVTAEGFNFYSKEQKFLSASATVKKNLNKFVVEGRLPPEEGLGIVEVTSPSWNAWSDQRKQRNNHAVVIAVSHFYDNCVAPLETAARDGVLIRNMFLNAGYSVDYLCDNPFSDRLGMTCDFLIPTMKNINRVLELAQKSVKISQETIMVVYIISRGAFGVCQGLSAKDSYLILAADTILSQINSRTCMNVDKLCFDRDAAGSKPQLFVDCWALPSAPFATTIPALGFAYFGGRSVGNAELTVLYARQIAGGLFTYYFLKGMKGYCCSWDKDQGSPRQGSSPPVEKQPADVLVTSSNLCGYLASKLQTRCDCTAHINSLSNNIIFFPDSTMPMKSELRTEKIAAQSTKVRITVVIQARCGDAAKQFAIDQSSSAWKRNTFKALLKTICSVDEVPTDTSWPSCPMRIAYTTESATTLQVHFKDLGDCIRDPMKGKALEMELEKTVKSMRLKVAHRPPWYIVRASDSMVDFACHDQMVVLKLFRNHFLNPSTFSHKPILVTSEVSLVIVLSEYHRRRLDKMVRLGTFTKQFNVTDLISDIASEDHHEAAVKIQSVARAFRLCRKYREQKGIMDQERDIRALQDGTEHAKFQKLVKQAYIERKVAIQHWEESARDDVIDWAYMALKNIIVFLLQNIKDTEDYTRGQLVMEQKQVLVMLEEMSGRYLLSSIYEKERRSLHFLKKIQEMQYWERYYVLIQEYQGYLGIRNLARFKTPFRALPPIKPVGPSLGTQQGKQAQGNHNACILSGDEDVSLPPIRTHNDRGGYGQSSVFLPPPIDPKVRAHMRDAIKSQLKAPVNMHAKSGPIKPTNLAFAAKKIGASSLALAPMKKEDRQRRAEIARKKDAAEIAAQSVPVQAASEEM